MGEEKKQQPLKEEMEIQEGQLEVEAGRQVAKTEQEDEHEHEYAELEEEANDAEGAVEEARSEVAVEVAAVAEVAAAPEGPVERLAEQADPQAVGGGAPHSEPGVSWYAKLRCWQASARKTDGSGNEITKFYARHHQAAGGTDEQAVEAARRAAVAHLRRRVAQGAVKQPRAQRAAIGGPGVSWLAGRRLWQVRAQKADGSGKEKKLFPVRRFHLAGGTAEEAVEAARQAAVAHLQRLVAQGVVVRPRAGGRRAPGAPPGAGPAPAPAEAAD